MQAKSRSRFLVKPKSGPHIFLLLLAYSFIWFILAGVRPAGWILGVPAVLLATVMAVFLAPGSIAAPNPAAAAIFIPYFIFLSLMSGIDVMRRTFSPKPRINPGLMTYKTRLVGPTRVLLANIISLLTGTLSADLEEDEIRVHLLDVEIPARENLEKLENRIARIFPGHARREDMEETS